VAGNGPAARPASGAGPELTRAATGRRVVALVPSARVLLTHAQVPARRASQLLAAVPYALEESLAGDVDDLHFAIGERSRDGAVQVAVVARTEMERWLEQLRELGLRPQVMLPDLLALPLEADHWSVWLDGATALVRTGLQAGFVAESENLELMLRLALQEAGDAAPGGLRLHPATPGHEPRLTLPGVTCTAAAQGPLLTLADPARVREGINLLQGDYGVRQQWGRVLRPWLPAAALLLVWLGLQGGLTVADLVRLQGVVARQGEAIVQVYRDTFPDAQRIVEPRTQMEQQLRALRAGQEGDAFLTLLQQSGAGLAQVPELRIDQLSYGDGRIDLQLTLPRLDALDRLKAALAGNGLSVDVVTANAASDSVQARLRIEKGAR